jgi:DNA repair protein RecN (Recombination protein N)
VLLQLRIKNFAIIDDCVIQLEPGLVAMTGETGAGKSIIVDALSACLGSRVGADSIRHDTGSAEVDAVFTGEPENKRLASALQDYDLAPDDAIVLSREIHRGGRSVGRINGRAAPVSLLAAAGDALVDLHGQSEHLSLLKSARQLDMLDHFAGTDDLRLRFAGAARELSRARERLHELRAGERTATQRRDLLRFQVEEIERAALGPEEQQELMAERARLSNAAKLAELASAALDLFQGDDVRPGAVDQLSQSARLLSQLTQIDAGMGSVQQQTETMGYQSQDLAVAIRQYRDQIEFDPPRLDHVSARLDEIVRLERKYGETVDDVLAFAETARAELALVEDYDEGVRRLETETRQAEEAAGALALELSMRRAGASERFTAQVRERLQRLGLGPARFEIALTRAPDPDGIEVASGAEAERVAFSTTGIDRIQFLVSFNAGEQLKPIERVASGGETARFMLAVKAVLATADDVPTLIFDEIDTGVGGRGGHVVGAMLRELAQSHQVVSITHLPQIAAQAGQHLKVVKSDRDGETGITVENLDQAGRVHELAEMLAGPSPSETVRKNAEELLSAGRGG